MSKLNTNWFLDAVKKDPLKCRLTQAKSTNERKTLFYALVLASWDFTRGRARCNKKNVILLVSPLNSTGHFDGVEKITPKISKCRNTKINQLPDLVHSINLESMTKEEKENQPKCTNGKLFIDRLTPERGNKGRAGPFNGSSTLAPLNPVGQTEHPREGWQQMSLTVGDEGAAAVANGTFLMEAIMIDWFRGTFFSRSAPTVLSALFSNYQLESSQI